MPDRALTADNPKPADETEARNAPKDEANPDDEKPPASAPVPR